jgi:glycosyltransferase involved in cell wall biosynthesis
MQDIGTGTRTAMAQIAAEELGIPFVVTVHGLDVFSIDQMNGYTRQWRRRMSQWVYRRAWRVLCISEKVRDQVTQGASKVQATVVYNGADGKMFSPASDAVSADTILSVGNLIPIKGHELLLRAFAANTPDYPNAPLAAGDFYRRRGKPDEALTLYETGLKSDRDRRLEYQERIAADERQRVPRPAGRSEQGLLPGVAQPQSEMRAVAQHGRWMRGEIAAPGGAEPPPAEAIRAALAGRNLACWCPANGPCHAELLLVIANRS